MLSLRRERRKEIGLLSAQTGMRVKQSARWQAVSRGIVPLDAHMGRWPQWQPMKANPDVSNPPTPPDTRLYQAGWVVRLQSGTMGPLTATPRQWKRLTGDPRDERSVRADCASGVLPCLPRRAAAGGHYRIAVSRALDQLGIPHEVVRADA